MLKIILLLSMSSILLMADAIGCNNLMQKLSKNSSIIEQLIKSKQFPTLTKEANKFQINLINARVECDNMDSELQKIADKAIQDFNSSEEILVKMKYLKASSKL